MITNKSDKNIIDIMIINKMVKQTIIKHVFHFQIKYKCLSLLYFMKSCKIKISLEQMVFGVFITLITKFRNEILYNLNVLFILLEIKSYITFIK